MSGFFTPFVEAPNVPGTRATADMSGSDTALIDHMRQGVEIITDVQRYAGTLPRLDTGEDDHTIDITVYGQSSEFIIDAKFEELVKFDPVAIIYNTASLVYPVVLDNASFNDIETIGGFVEPLTIDARNFLVSTTEFEPHTIRGTFGNGNEDAFRRSDTVVSIIDSCETVQALNLYVDASDSMGVASGAINLGGLFPEGEKTITPFNESAYLNRTFASGSLSGSNSYGIVVAIVSMSSDSDILFLARQKSTSTGFTYDNSPYGVDSIAFGGMRRS